MRRKLSYVHAALILLFTAGAVLYGLGASGRLTPYLQQELYPALQRVSTSISDLKMRIRGRQPVHNPIVVVEIDSQSLELVGRWPWRRDLMVGVLSEIFAQGPKVVGLDITFPEPQVPVPEELREELRRRRLEGLLAELDFDGQLAGFVARHRDRLVLGWKTEALCRPALSYRKDCDVMSFRDAIPGEMDRFAAGLVRFPVGFHPAHTPLETALTVIPNIPELNRAARHSGFVNSFRDADGVYRRLSLLMMARGLAHPSFALEVAKAARRDFLDITIGADGALQRLAWGRSGTAIPATRGAMMTLGYRGPARTFPYVSVVELFDEKSPRRALLKDAVVLVGVTALAAYDQGATPFDQQMPGVEVQATAVDNLLSQAMIQSAVEGKSFWAVILLMLLGGGLFSYFIQRLSGYRALILIGFSLAGLALLDYQIYVGRSVDLGTAFLYGELLFLGGTAVAAKYLREEKYKNFLRSAFAHYLAPPVVEAILSDPAHLSLGGRRERVTVLFCDIRGFTSFAERVDPKLLSEFINDYLSVMTDELFAFQGTLDKYIGDAVMAFWGAPLTQPDHARRACEAALAMARQIDRHRERFRERYGIALEVGFGIHSGPVTVGNLGSEKSFNYTVIGDTVNLASRLEGATKAYGAGILTTGDTIGDIVNAGQAPPPYRALGEATVKGRAGNVEVVELLTRPLDEECLRRFEEGRRLFKARRFREAAACFEDAEKRSGGPDPVCRRFLQRCLDLEKLPPDENWDGSWNLAA